VNKPSVAVHSEEWNLFAYTYVRSRDIAEELVQDVFLAVWGSRETWDVHTRVRAWLFASVRHLALNHLRHERIVARTIQVAQTVSGDDAAAEALAMAAPSMDQLLAIEAEELDNACLQAIGQLPDRRRIAMTLRWKHDMSALEIARVIGTTPEAVRTLLTRARADLTALLEGTRQ
jgi:RNA polymerase sigma-70 factor, ECF subfamily